MEKFFKIKNIGNIKIISVAALFAAISIVCGKFLAFNIGDTLRFSFENLPIILMGIYFGPIVGATTGIVADIVGCVLRGYVINPILTFAAAVIGFLSGCIFQLLARTNINFNLAVTVFCVHLIGSVVIKSVGLSFWFGSPIFITLFQRGINYLIIFILEYTVILLLYKNKSLHRQISKLQR